MAAWLGGIVNPLRDPGTRNTVLLVLFTVVIVLATLLLISPP